MTSFWGYLRGTVIRPRRTFIELMADPRRLTLGCKAVLLIGALYTLTVIGMAVAGAEITSPPWVAISGDGYYFWEIFFALPVLVLGWILAGGLTQLLSKAFGAAAPFEGALALLGFAISVPMFLTWIPETLGTILLLMGIMSQGKWL